MLSLSLRTQNSKNGNILLKAFPHIEHKPFTHFDRTSFIKEEEKKKPQSLFPFGQIKTIVRTICDN